MIRFTLLALVCTYTLTCFGQNYNISTLNYTWSDSLPSFTPDTNDQKYSTVFLKLLRINEFYLDRVNKTFDFYYTNHNIKYVNDNKGVEDNNKFYASVGSENSFLGLTIRVIHMNKVIFEATEKDFIEVVEDGNTYKMIAIKGLDKGMIIESVTRYKYSNFEVYGDEYMQFTSPSKLSEFYLISPEQFAFKCKSYNNFSPIKDTLVNGRFVYYAAKTNIPGSVSDETYGLENANKMRVEYNFHQYTESKKLNAKWPELGKDFFDRLNYEYDKNVKDIQKALSKLKWKEITNNSERIFAVENFLKQNISIDANIDNKKTVSETFKARVATPFRFNQIMAQCFRYTECNVEYVLTCRRNYKRFDPEFDSWSYLNDVLFYDPTSKRFIDPKSTYTRIGYINTEFLNQYGLFIKLVRIGDAVSATASVSKIPGNDVTKSTDFENYLIRFNENADETRLSYNRNMYGYAEQNLKALYYIMDDDNRKKTMDEFVKGMAKESKIDSLEILNYDPTLFTNLDKPLTIHAALTSSAYIESTGPTSFLFKIGEVIGQQSEMYQEKERQNPVDIDFAHAYKRTITVIIPEGYQVKGLDKLNMKYEYPNEQGKQSIGFISNYTLQGNVLVVNCYEYYNDMFYSLGFFNQFKQVINAAADFNKISILIEKK